eukprot:5849627-Alexandrium_andersonii.AAC.1
MVLAPQVAVRGPHLPAHPDQPHQLRARGVVHVGRVVPGACEAHRQVHPQNGSDSGHLEPLPTSDPTSVAEEGAGSLGGFSCWRCTGVVGQPGAVQTNSVNHRAHTRVQQSGRGSRICLGK